MAPYHLGEKDLVRVSFFTFLHITKNDSVIGHTEVSAWARVLRPPEELRVSVLGTPVTHVQYTSVTFGLEPNTCARTHHYGGISGKRCIRASVHYGCSEEEGHVRITWQRACLLTQKCLNWWEPLEIHGQEIINIINCISKSEKPPPQRSTWYKRVKETQVSWLPIWQSTSKRHRNEETYSLSWKRSAFWSENCTWLNDD